MLLDGGHLCHVRVGLREELGALVHDAPDLVEELAYRLVLIHRLEVTDQVAGANEDRLPRVGIEHVGAEALLALGTIHIWVGVL